MSRPERGEVLLLEIGAQRYGLPTSDVREVLRAVTVVPLPKAPPIVLGVINVRGTVVPVLDIRTRFRLPAREILESDHFVVATAGERLVAICADRALDLKEISANEVEEATRTVPGAEYVAGIAKLPDGLVLIHDLRSFLSQAEGAQLAEAMSEPEQEQR
ncbi:MAG: purine-binding chemotaxis protein CheW [Acidobacteria bacterium]|nr:purine-binding chemotaxis protein CheW [Acidobacteriota bacterium]